MLGRRGTKIPSPSSVSRGRCPPRPEARPSPRSTPHREGECPLREAADQGLHVVAEVVRPATPGVLPRHIPHGTAVHLAAALCEVRQGRLEPLSTVLVSDRASNLLARARVVVADE